MGKEGEPGGSQADRHEDDQAFSRGHQHLSLLEEVGMPMDRFNPPTVRIDGDNVSYTVRTQSENSPEMRAIIETLRGRGCTVEIDRGTALETTFLRITAPLTLLPDEEIRGIREEAAAKAERTSSVADTTRRESELLSPYESC